MKERKNKSVFYNNQFICWTVYGLYLQPPCKLFCFHPSSHTADHIPHKLNHLQTLCIPCGNNKQFRNTRSDRIREQLQFMIWLLFCKQKCLSPLKLHLLFDNFLITSPSPSPGLTCKCCTARFYSLFVKTRIYKYFILFIQTCSMPFLIGTCPEFNIKWEAISVF